MPEKTSDNKRPVCPKCGSGNIVVRADQSILCRRCGNDSRRVK